MIYFATKTEPSQRKGGTISDFLEYPCLTVKRGAFYPWAKPFTNEVEPCYPLRMLSYVLLGYPPAPKDSHHRVFLEEQERSNNATLIKAQNCLRIKRFYYI